MKISKIRISNILGIDQLELSPQGFTEISGQNGTGKTSVLEAIKSVLNAGHDATLLRNGAEKGEVVLVLDNGMELSKTVTQATSATNVRRDGKKLQRPVEVIKALTDALSVNPIEFLLAPKKERVRVLLEAMPLEADTDHLSEITGVNVKPQAGTHALHVIETVREQVFNERTGTNRAAREKQATINQLEAAIPPLPQGVSGDEEELETQIIAITDKRDDTLSRIRTKLDRLTEEAAAAIETIRSKAQAEIDAVNAALAEQRDKAAAARENAHKAYNEAIGPVNAQVATVRADRESAGRRKQTIDTIATLTTELEALTAEADRLTGALEAIDQYKVELLSKLPIPGVEIIDGDVMRNGVHFDRLNTAQQVEIAVEVAKLRAADLGVVCVDRIECLDSAMLDAFRESAANSDLQMFVTRVSDEDFSVTTQ